MPQRYVLIDFENVQPDDLSALPQEDLHVLVFVGANQSKISLDTAMALQRLGTTARYIQIAGSGPNALDFHIAYYLGKLAAEHPDAHFQIVSKDRGFDPLIHHLRDQRLPVSRTGDIRELGRTKAAKVAPAPARPRIAAPAARPATSQDPAEIILDRLRRLGATGRPRTLKTLSSSINAVFQKKLTPSRVEELVKELENLGFLTIVQSKVTYSLPE